MAIIALVIWTVLSLLFIFILPEFAQSLSRQGGIVISIAAAWVITIIFLILKKGENLEPEEEDPEKRGFSADHLTNPESSGASLSGRLYFVTDGIEFRAKEPRKDSNVFLSWQDIRDVDFGRFFHSIELTMADGHKEDFVIGEREKIISDIRGKIGVA